MELRRLYGFAQAQCRNREDVVEDIAIDLNAEESWVGAQILRVPKSRTLLSSSQ